uniref:DNA-directed RNA polymerase n=1 Tax=Apophlaea sinclairii TaxID=212746 RepID=A0A1C9CBJ3_9FLOR|nr:RNA polymerase beta'' subunit [Apophlaea sinclairii]AOM65729.1 RNA polymerase beta'' subunit [Apophlaea sinclairii]
MQNKSVSFEFSFINKSIDKKQLTELIVWAFSKYGIARAANMADQLKDLGFNYATTAGLSLSIEDLRIPAAKKILLRDTLKSIENTDNQYIRAEITAVERFQKVIDTWHNMSEILKEEIIKYFREVDPLNPIYIMSLSGARGNMSQVRQLVGMRGLMSDPNGQILDLPITSNFREGLTVTEYFISSYGARKGLVDTALRTADSGYLTRRLVDVAQHIIVHQADCLTNKGIIMENMIDSQKTLIPVEQSLLGRTAAENIYHPRKGTLIVCRNQTISSDQATQIVTEGVPKILVRSPLTCESESGVCQFCYGWNLAHRRLVDIGEAVGVIAAQSIGEPGTQLTMRTFHTGGVFTGEIAQKIYSPVKGIIKYPQKIKLTNIRTKYGDLAYVIEHNSSIFVESSGCSKVKIVLSKGTTLLVNNYTIVEKDQVIALSSLSNQFITEEAEKEVITNFSGKVVFANLVVQETKDNQIIVRSTKKEGLIWVLSGQVYDIPSSSNIIVNKSKRVKKYTPLAEQKVTNQYSGYVRLRNTLSSDSKTSTEIQIITAQLILRNSQVNLQSKEFQGIPLIETTHQEKFILQVTVGERILNGHILAELVSEVYKTVTGGIIKYLNLPVAHKKSKSLKNSYEVIGTGYILWIPEETHEVNKDYSLLYIEHGDNVEVGTELTKNVFARISGIVEIVKRKDTVREIIIKPGILYHNETQDISLLNISSKGFLRPGDKINEESCTDKLVYWEYLRSSDKIYILIRPVIVYSVPSKNYALESEDEYNKLKIKVVKATKFRDGERVKSISGVNLIKSYVVVYIKDTYSDLYTSLEYTPIAFAEKLYQLKLVTLETISIKNSYINTRYQNIDVLVKQHDKILANTVVLKVEIFSTVDGIVEDVCSTNKSHRRVLIVCNNDKYMVKAKISDKILVQLHQWIYTGDLLTESTKAQYSGQIINIQKNVITLRIARPYLLSSAADLHVNNYDLVQQGESIATIKFNRPKTKDIVQGLPKIEEILEARKKIDAVFKPHEILAESFKNYLQISINLRDAARLSLHKIQLHLVKEIQLVYQSQKVDIADKHIEVIVKQMTSKIEIKKGGNTQYLPAEMVDINKIEILNKIMLETNKQPALYFPILLGITKASLNTESFISAASFQETTKVLTEAAIAGKLDWLKGLKENVIIGRLIPAGTGFNIYNYTQKQTQVRTSLYNESIMKNTITKDTDDIILDDRTIHHIVK